MAISWFELRDARLLSGLTQSQLADKMGVSLRSVVSYERPDSVIPRKAEHGIRSVLAEELSRLARIHEEHGYTPSADSDLSGVVSLPAAISAIGRNPRLAGLTSAELLRELLARDQSEAATSTGGEAVVTEIVSGRSDDELREIVDQAQRGNLAAAAGSDETAPDEYAD